MNGEKDRVKELDAEIKKLKIALADALESLKHIVNETYQADVNKTSGLQLSKEATT